MEDPFLHIQSQITLKGIGTSTIHGHTKINGIVFMYKVRLKCVHKIVYSSLVSLDR